MNLHSSTGYAKSWTLASLFMPPVPIKHRKTTYLLKKEWMLAGGGGHILVMAGKIWAPSSSECLYMNASALPVLGHSYYNISSKALFPVFNFPLYLQVFQPPIRSSLVFSEFLSKRVFVKMPVTEPRNTAMLFLSLLSHVFIVLCTSDFLNVSRMLLLLCGGHCFLNCMASASAWPGLEGPSPLCDEEEMSHPLAVCSTLSSSLQGIVTFTLLKTTVNVCFNHSLIIIAATLKAVLEGNELNGPKQDVTQCRPSVSNLLHSRTYLIKASLSPFQGYRADEGRVFFLWDGIIWGRANSAASRSHWHHMQTVYKAKERPHSMM